ncbi:MAG: RHS repeat-associated core domain-containing protein [Verrucomicrobiota bacterium]|nr:RHS repeat-associated core domain-containing protein [Verrucomicrobiota bacterium]
MKSASSGTHFVAFDGNGNVAGLVAATDGTVSATYEYDSFGQTIRATGEMADVTPIRFSTKYTDSETGYCYYGYRYYTPSTGRWTSRDPLTETGHKILLRERSKRTPESGNLYVFVFNRALSEIDIDGRIEGSKKCGEIISRAIDPNDDPSWWDRLHESISGALYPHLFLILSDGTRLTHGGSADGENHRTARRQPIMIPTCMRCEDFNECAKKNWPKSENYSTWHNNCGHAVSEVLSKCGATNDLYPDPTVTY